MLQYVCGSALTLDVVQVDFDAPLGYKEPERRPPHHEEPVVGNRWDLLCACLFYTFPPLTTRLVLCCYLAGGGRGSKQLC